MDVKDAALLLYMGGMEQQAIATLVRRSENTISNWKKEEGWEDKKRKRDVQNQTSEDSIRELIDYQLTALKERKDSWLKDRHEGDYPRLIEKGDIDALQKLYSTIKKNEREWEDTVFVMRDFLLWLERHDLQQAKAIVDSITFYLNDKRDG